MPEPILNVSPEVLRGTLPLDAGAARLRGHLGKKLRDDPEALRRASRDFESLLVKQLLSEMRKTVPQGGFLAPSMAREWFEEMLDQALAEEISRGRGVGLADAFFEQISRLGQGVRPSGSLPPARGSAQTRGTEAAAPPPAEKRVSYE